MAQPYHPGFDGRDASLSPRMNRPQFGAATTSTPSISIQRQVKTPNAVEAGYIGRLVHHEYIMQNPNAIPYMMSQGGQSFALGLPGDRGRLRLRDLCQPLLTTAAKQERRRPASIQLSLRQPFLRKPHLIRVLAPGTQAQPLLSLR